jgi:hypothetical protein
MDDKDKNGNPVDLRAYGPEEDGSHRRIEVDILPCTYVAEDPSFESARLKKTY